MFFSTPWFASNKPRPNAQIRLFCFPYAGGGASVFYTWSEVLPPTIEVCSVRLPGRENRIREAPFTRMEPLVQALAQALIPYLDKPFAFFGHSLGALVSFEVARQLRKTSGLLPVQLFVSGCGASQVLDSYPPIHALPDAEFIKELHLLNGLPKEALGYPELIELMLPTLRADFAVYETYAYSIESPLDCPVSAFGGLQDGRVPRDALAAWREQTSASFKLQMFPGDHFFLHTAQAFLLQTIACKLQPVRSLNP